MFKQLFNQKSFCFAVVVKQIIYKDL